MTEKISILIVDDLAETRQNVSKLLQFEPDIEVVGQASNGDEAIQLAQEYVPDVILMDINMPGQDGITTSRAVLQAIPSVQIIIMSVQSEADYLRKAMMAGARDFLMKPFGGDELAAAIRGVYKMRPKVVMPAAQPTQNGTSPSPEPTKNGKIISVFSPKGGSGCTTIAINTAVDLTKRGFRTILIDGRMQFGDISVMLNLKPTSTILDVVDRIEELDIELMEIASLTHESGLKILLSPPRPEMAELVTVDHMQAIMEMLQQMYDFIIVDTSSNLTGIVLDFLDRSDRVLLIALQTLPSLKNSSQFYNLAEFLEYEPDKVMLIVNKASNKMDVSVKDISDILKRSVVSTIPVDEAAALSAADRGFPLVAGPAQKRPIATALTKLTSEIIENLGIGEEETQPEVVKASRLGKLFGAR